MLLKHGQDTLRNIRQGALREGELILGREKDESRHLKVVMLKLTTRGDQTKASWEMEGSCTLSWSGHSCQALAYASEARRVYCSGSKPVGHDLFGEVTYHACQGFPIQFLRAANYSYRVATK